jgi:hypothetical protein
MRHTAIESRLLPGGDLVSALFNREVMMLADRGGASNLIGDRWADVAAAHAATWVGQELPHQGNDAEAFRVTDVARLDATPRVAAAASRRGLQNPDLLLIGQRGDEQFIRAADAKFSVETARAKQVSPEVVLGLLALNEEVPDLLHLQVLADRPVIQPGVFLSPDYPLSHLMLRRRHGIVRTTVRPDEVILVPAPADVFWQGVEGATIMSPLAGVDDLPVSPETSLMAGVYYFRLARAAVGFWLDAKKPLLLYNDVVPVDESAIRADATHRAQSAPSAIELIRQWDADVQTIRNQRAAVDQVAALPIPGRELRPMAARIALAAGGSPPSANQVRRRLAAWYRRELRDRVGSIAPPVADLPAVLRQIERAGRDLAPQAERELERIVTELMMEAETRDAATAGRLQP